ncbi:methyltransferase domain-containing protein [Colletotrichum scovillei]|uniref:Methyltransferase domain-containing protein n=1 Tax=Colletotrichum scovillei TaxID=1209932 RepID=A0A9P7QTC2_9PEZI|nr:methyltransferase domain-containing protein [Colletotrichum scovillei]KAG7043129.1 methyltransferase domain-containing protein [Colletotrichum scovillei]KAG7062577.1 methyltransferase domain-containing protein [Colletotrichum scovillei]
MAGSPSPRPTTPLANVAGVDAPVQTVASPPAAASSPAVTSEPAATPRVAVSSEPAETSEPTATSELIATSEPTATSEPVATPTPTSPLAVQNSPPETAATPTPNTPGLIEASDDGASTDGSTIDERITNYSASLTSSVVDYPVEYGRRYHAFRPGSYSFPNDEREMERLDIAHALMVRSIGNRLFLAPLRAETLHRVLDIGTGTGIWSVEMGDIFENAEITGNDLSPIQPGWVPANVRFEIDDVESPWINEHKYDYIFCRYMLISIQDWPRLIRNMYDNVNPGGWVEFQDMDGLYYSDDGTYTEDHATRQWNRQYIDACEAMGRTARPGPQLEGWVRDAGFQNITHQRFKVPIGPWAKDEYYADVGMLNLVQLLEGLEGFTLKIFCGFLGQTKEEVMVLLARVRKELKEGACHAIFDHHVVYAQKPFEEEGNNGGVPPPV